MADTSRLVSNMDSEKPIAKKESLIRRILAHDKPAAILTFVSAVIAFSLSLVALLSGAEKGQLQNYEVVIMNTSTILQNAIKVSSVGAASVTARAVLPSESSAPTPVIDVRQDNPFGISAISSFFSSVGSDLTPTATAVAGAGGSTGSTSGSGLLGDLESFITDVFGNVTTTAADEVVSITNTLIGDVTSALGIKQWYAIYMTELCSGNYINGGSTRNVTSCTQLNKLHVNQTNSTLQLGNTVLDFSAINIPNKLSKGTGALAGTITAVIALQIIGIVCTGLLIFLTPMSLFLSFFKKWWFTLIVATLTFIATGSFVVVTFIETGIRVIVDYLASDVVDGLGLYAYGGTGLIVILWIKFIFMATSSTVWFFKWHMGRYVVREKEVKRPKVETARSNFPAIYRIDTPPTPGLSASRAPKERVGREI